MSLLCPGGRCEVLDGAEAGVPPGAEQHAPPVPRLVPGQAGAGPRQPPRHRLRPGHGVLQTREQVTCLVSSHTGDHCYIYIERC